MKADCIVISHRNKYGLFYSSALEISGLITAQSPAVNDCSSLISSNTNVKILLFFCDSKDFADSYKKNSEKLDVIEQHIIIVSEPSFTSFFKNTNANVIVHSFNLFNLMGIIKSFGLKINEEVQNSEVSNFEFILNKLKNGDITLPVNNDTAVHILSKLQDEMIHFKDLAQTVRLDPSIHSGIIKLSNSAYFGGSTQINTLEKSMIRLGINNVKIFLINYINKALIKNKQLIFIEQMKNVIDHALDVASLNFVIASEKFQKEKEQMFSLGIIHNIGRIFLYATFSEMLQDKDVDERTIEQYENLVEANYIKIGAKLLRIWNFPDSIVCPIIYHKNFTKNQYNNATLILGISNAFMNNDLSTPGLPDAMKKYKLTKTEMDQFMDRAKEYKSEALSIFE